MHTVQTNQGNIPGIAMADQESESGKVSVTGGAGFISAMDDQESERGKVSVTGGTGFIATMDDQESDRGKVCVTGGTGFIAAMDDQESDRGKVCVTGGTGFIAAMDDQESDRGKVCVTGGAGFIASWLIMRLLQRGYSVRATVRLDPKFKEETDHLKSLPHASEKLEIVEADLFNPETFATAIDGCIGVFHTAHPMGFTMDDPERTVISPAVEGVLGILKACVASKTVRRVVYTSSAGAAAFDKEKEGEKDQVMTDEEKWIDVGKCMEQKTPIWSYIASKAMAEKAALEFGAEHGLDVVTVLPSSVVGPFLVPCFPFSLITALAPVLGNIEQCKLLKQTGQFVHVDDVASAHIYLFESPSAKGRYICSAVGATFHMLVKFFQDKFPELNIREEFLNEIEEEENPEVLYSKKLLELGFEFKHGLEEMLTGAVQCCKQKGFL